MSKLYIIGSPIGNLEDITIRAVDILKNLEYVFSEDTRISSKLMKKFDINTSLLPIYTSKKELNKNKYDFVFYVAGVDIHFEDRLGKLKITDDGINKRDQIVIENFYSKNTPLCGVLGGGYNKSFEKLIELHSMLHKNCAEYF